MSFTLRTIARSISTRFPLNYQRINNVSWRTNHSQSVTSEKGLPRCPSCGGPLRTHLPACNFCDSISPVPSSWTHYEVLDVPAKPNPFELDPAFLKKRFRALQSVSHPDTWASKGPKAQEVAQNLSGRINTAYQTLLNPLSRIEYLLELNGHGIGEADKVTDMEFLGEIFERMEEVGDLEPGHPDREKIAEQTKEDIQNTLSRIHALAQDEKWKEAKDEALQLKYLYNVPPA